TKRVINKSHVTKQGCAVPPHMLYKLFLYKNINKRFTYFKYLYTKIIFCFRIWSFNPFTTNVMIINSSQSSIFNTFIIKVLKKIYINKLYIKIKYKIYY